MKNFKGIFLLILSSGLLMACTKIQDSFNYVVLNEYGTFEVTTDGESSAPGTSSGSVKTLTSQKLILKTERIPGKLHTTFGIIYTVNGLPAGREVHLTSVLKHPAIKNPDTNIISTQDEYEVQTAIGEQYWDCFSFDHDWEIAPGAWTYQVVQDGKVLMETSFEIVPEK